MTLKHSFISGLGGAVPERTMGNHDLEKIVDTSDEWISTRTGIKARRIASPEQATSDLAIEAAYKALKDAHISPQQIDLIICATFTPDKFLPSTACLIQKGLKTYNAAAFDISAACSGFIYALSIADSFIKTGKCHNILVIGAETLSRITDWEDRSTCVLFGDGAGAVVLSESQDESRIFSVNIFSDGQLSDLLEIPGGGSRYPTSHETVDQRLHYIKMKGNETFKIAVKSMFTASIAVLDQNNISVDEVDLFISHQANDRIIKATAEKLGVNMDKVFINIDNYGNTSAASIPLALWDAKNQGKLSKGTMVLLSAFGGGLTWGSALLRW